ncbi:hypothetical protein EDC40_101148 [Aminobacter aminovorans]|uniref:Uncharacterized protein n=1 Tax=Aminobacter aminovorans TaxID=83263 RepID=A0A380WQR2_AMIAI|nr:hypothetical protein [Aminobacter aminovorans]TCS29833.1 hypothetical protein EDC40_101148 [Aminobacter aminovorans]SUU90682.1 Uncharacterised protein [Aminobacter aminovorans]
MGLFIELLIDPARMTFMAFLLATALELKNRTASTICLGAIVFAVLMPLVFRPTEAPGKHIALGLIANLLLLAIFYRFHTLVLRRLDQGSNRLLMELFDLFRSRKALSERALLAEARARSQNRALLRSAISTIGGERIAAGSDTQLAARSASLLTRHVMTPGSADDGAERLLAGMFAQIAAAHFSRKIGTNFDSAVAQAVLEITDIADRHELGNIIGIYYELCAENNELTATVRQFFADWMADPTQEKLDRLGSLRLLLIRLMTDDGLGDFQKTTGSPSSPPAQRLILLVDWHNRPAVIGEAGALAMLKPNSPWVEVNFRDVLWTARKLRGPGWRGHFRSFGELNPPTHLLDQISRPPRQREPIVRSAAAPASAPSPALPTGTSGESGCAAPPPDTTLDERPILLVNWDNRPAIISGGGAFAMLEPSSPWVEVDFRDVLWTSDMLTEAAWRERFKSFGELNPPTHLLDQVSPSPRAQEPVASQAPPPAASAPPSPALPAGAAGESASAALPETKPYVRTTQFMNWDSRPAVIGEAGAFAMLKPNSPWVEVDFTNVLWTAGVLPQADWRERFKNFGELNPPMLDQVSPRAQEPIVRSVAAPSASTPPSPALPAGAAGESASAAPPDTKPYKRPTNLVNWDNRPAIIGDAGAFAMLKPNSSWVEVDFLDVWRTADILSEEAWRERFKRFGELNPPMIDQVSPAAARDIE